MISQILRVIILTEHILLTKKQTMPVIMTKTVTVQRKANWATEWQNAHTQGTDWYNCSSAHSQPLNANQKAYAAWWLWARLAGWDGN